jgi:hypothetical protein
VRGYAREEAKRRAQATLAEATRLLDRATRTQRQAYLAMKAIPHASDKPPTVALEAAADHLDIAEAELEFASSYYEMAKRHLASIE